MKARLSLRKRPKSKPPPPGIVLSEASIDRRNFKLANVGQSTILEPTEALAESKEEPVSFEQREAQIKRYEADLVLHYKELRDRQVEVEGAQREASERLMLAEKREAILEEKERFLKNHSNDLAEAALIDRLKLQIESQKTQIIELRSLLDAANERIKKFEGEKDSTEINSPNASIDEVGLIADPINLNDAFQDEGTASLLAERETYIEASEEALLLKSQQLEELESHLKQWQEELESKAESA